MSQADLMLLLDGGALLVFLAVIRLAWGHLPWFPWTSGDRMNSTYQDRCPDPEEPWVRRARMRLARLPLPPPRSGQLEGWSWRSIERDPVLAVQVDARSDDGRRISGHLTGTPGTLHVTCGVRTDLRIAEGWISLKPDGGPGMSLRAGDSIILHPGFSGDWLNETITHIRFEVTLR